MTVIFSYLKTQESPGYILQEDTGRIIIDEETVDGFDEGAVTEAIVQIQTINPVAIFPIGTFNLNTIISLPEPTFIERITAITTNTSIAIATGATICVITPSPTNTATITLKGATGDTGIVISKTQPTVLDLDPSQGTFFLNASSITTVKLTFL